jgi:beta-galactosidase
MYNKNAIIFRNYGLSPAWIFYFGLCCWLLGAEAEASATATLRQQTLLDADWLFHLGDMPDNEATATNYDDSSWQQVNLPHDYVLEGAYSRTNDPKHGYLPYKPAWYRKHFIIPESDTGKILRLDFDGVFRDSRVWINGSFLGEHPSGYTPFSYDISHIAKFGADNIIAVCVDPSQFEGHWYEGGGIYRHLHLTALAPLHIAQYGTYVIATVPNGDQGADDLANLTIQTTIENTQNAPANAEIVSDIIGPDGKLLKTIKTDETVPADSRHETIQQTVLGRPRLWSPQSSSLYQLRTTVLQDGVLVDSTTTTFGIRTLRYGADKGFFLNGEHVEIQGVANHQDFPGVGIAVPDSLQAWRVEQLKKMGCNAWRTAHNPPNEALLDACDRLGMMVMDENRHLGDAYTSHSPRGTTATNLSDLATMIQRDRNHPSIIMWSLCNEEGQRRTQEGIRIFAAMKKVARRYDNTRPITCAINSSLLTNGIDDEDIIGVNYRYRNYDDIHRANPRFPMFGSEATNEKTTRGEYASDPVNGRCSCYNLSVTQWLAAADRPFIAGSFTWTGFDYKGEPNPYDWPDVANNTGLMDSCGFPKDKYYYFESCWSDKPMVHLMPASWNWPGKEGQNIRVIAFSNARQVELFLNGQSLGVKGMPHDGYVEWEVPYRPGKLVAIASSNGKTVAMDTVETTGKLFRILLSPGRMKLHADAEDAVVVSVSILDDKGRLIPDAANRVTFQLIGNGQILGVGNGDPADHDTDNADNRNAFHGHCMAVIEAGSRTGTLKLTATSPGLVSDSVKFKVR